MIIDLPGSTKTEKFGDVQQVSQFGIRKEDSPYVFNILRKKTYSNPEKAVIREYATNANDAHVENNVQDPIEITLPTWDNLVFKVRDFGKGLSQTAMTEIFGNYGCSTKRNSNKYTGALGIGSKSALAIGDSFLVTSIIDDEKSIYNCCLDESGIGKIELIGRSPSKERTGVEISVPVSGTEIYKFLTEASNVFKYFEKKPRFLNANISTDITFWKKGNGWAIGHEQSVIVMGNVAYPINSEHFPEYEKLLSSGIIIWVEIGSVDMAASREALYYSNKTIDFVNQKLNEVLNEVSNQIQSEVSVCKNLNEVSEYILYLEGVSEKSVSFICKNIKWNNFSISTRHNIPVSSVYTVGTYQSKTFVNLSSETKINLKSHPIFILCSNSDILLSSRVKYFQEKNYGKPIYIVKGNTEQFKRDFPLRDNHYINANDLPKRPKTAYNNNSNKIYNPKYCKKVFVKNDSYSGNGSQAWDIPKEEDFNADILIHVEINRFDSFVSGQRMINLKNLMTLLDKTITIFGIKSGGKEPEDSIEFPQFLKNQFSYFKTLFNYSSKFIGLDESCLGFQLIKKLNIEDCVCEQHKKVFSDVLMVNQPKEEIYKQLRINQLLCGLFKEFSQPVCLNCFDELKSIMPFLNAVNLGYYSNDVDTIANQLYSLYLQQR